MNRAHKIRINPTPEQAEYFWQCCGVARFTWNWALAEYNAALERGEKPNVMALKKEFNRLRKDEGFAPFVADVQTHANQYAFQDLQAAISKYFQDAKAKRLPSAKGKKPRKDGRPHGWPRFKARDRTTPAAGFANAGIRVKEHWLTLSRCPGPVNMAEPLRFDGKIMSGRLSYSAGHWYISLQVEMDDPEPTADMTKAVGIDLGIKYRAVTSDGEIEPNQKHLAGALRKLARLQRSMARMKDAAKADGRKLEDSRNYQKRKMEVARLHARVARLRSEQAHEFTTGIVRTYGVVGVEDLNIRGMVRNRRLARALSDAAMYQVRQQLGYKMQTSGGDLVVVDRWFASSKTCSKCHQKVNYLPLSVRKWACPNCGAEHDRDGNAAVNIREEALRMLGR